MAMINNGFEIQHVKRTLEISHQIGTQDKRLYTVFTRVNPCNEDERLKIEKKLGYTVTDILPNEYQMISLANSGRIAKGLPENSLMMKTLNGIAEGIISGAR